MEERILVTRSSMPDFDEYTNEIKKIWETHWLTNHGTIYEELKAELKEYLKVPEMDLLVNGHLALEIAIAVMNLSGEVITTPFTFASTTHAIVRNGLTPVFCDVKENGTIDEDKIESLITDKTSAIIPVHVYGQICNVERIQEIADKHHLKVIYDAAHAFGVTYKDKGIASYGDASMLSFHATKVFNTIEGGAVCFHDKEYKKKILDLSNFGIESEESVRIVGTNAKMNEFQAAMGVCNLRHVDGEIEKRKRVVEQYREELKEIDGISYFEEQKDVKSNYAYFPIIVDQEKYGMDRNQLADVLAAHNIFARKYFYPIVSDYECYKDTYCSTDTPCAKRMGDSVLTLPMYADLGRENVERICRIIKEKQ
ncbi:DegT/DnrJ/EryC1/StrS family aminotransferase [Roseburia inulinivorans]|jgi:dTDP-4-amino-4,6-dideoxygalactose transaminase|uniref:DegT/DnrJ/EryC1/StrS family aminotransferase n=1 Tax=Roseburia inulinivorans TaxID=360807 RepID=A0A414LYL4_9FIRM|nr:DegT/DnrJ/EryC1/StrS family aminotransferase [Roseburia inulinivorans]RHE99990.1 DegT/DnrJ/EryC1/StrS family aminotransferase [Roseburia inulinivorans]